MCLISDTRNAGLCALLILQRLLLQQFYLYTLLSSLGINEADLHNPTMHLNFLNPFILDVQLFSFSLNSIHASIYISFLFFFRNQLRYHIDADSPRIKSIYSNYYSLFVQSSYTCILHKMTCNYISYDYNKCEINLLLKLSNTYPKLIHSV